MTGDYLIFTLLFWRILDTTVRLVVNGALREVVLPRIAQLVELVRDGADFLYQLRRFEKLDRETFVGVLKEALSAYFPS